MSSRRRNYDDDDEDNYPSRKRRRFSAEPKEIEDRLESLIVRVGDKSTSSLESNLEGLAGVLEADLPSYKAKIMRILGECVTRLPEKTTIYTTLVGLLNVRNYNFGGEFVELLVKSLREALKSRKFEDARVTVRFLADLVNCHVISAGSMINFLQALADVSGETGIPQVRADFYVYTVLCALPWVSINIQYIKVQLLL
ncbi:Nuclear cap-binding protein subunit 1 [Araneus ventricosus]|uniref:Nuclear cap-binding protein subunit 1 n=1 Tax=Araneus ventricosus TaxID=182803 RepID=A0A4Y2FQT2_ARAVE|nr:Nuclear cap-binding protein subunit 1 [Araneus ventricosus]